MRKEKELKEKGYTLLFPGFETKEEAKARAEKYRAEGKKARVDMGDSRVGIHTFYVWHTGV
jgi:hypothetical protein